MRKLDVQNCGLKTIHAAVDTFHHVISLAAVTGECCHPIRQTVIIGHSASGITIRAKVLGGVKREGGYVPECPNLPTFVLSHVCLSTIFNDPEFMFPGNCHDRIHVCRLTIKMDWDDTDSCRCDLLLDQC